MGDLGGAAGAGCAARAGLSLGLEDLQREFELVEQVSVLTCISNKVGGRLVGSSRWTGVRLRDVLDRAGLRRGARDLLFRSADGYTSALALEEARGEEVLLAIAQNGRPLTRAHGFPCRLCVPALYGMKNPKWIERIEVRRRRERTYWVRRGWSDVAKARTSSRIDVAKDATVGESAWIARLQKPLSPYAWTQWAYRYEPDTPGTKTVLCRATDGRGAVQERGRREPHPVGATRYHAVPIKVSAA